MKRAQRGGQIGMNGENYAGGTFLPNTTLTKMAKATRRPGGRVKVDEFKWEPARDGLRPIFPLFPYHPAHHPDMRERVNPAMVDVPLLDSLYAKWVAGERWIAAH